MITGDVTMRSSLEMSFHQHFNNIGLQKLFKKYWRMFDVKHLDMQSYIDFYLRIAKALMADWSHDKALRLANLEWSRDHNFAENNSKVNILLLFDREREREREIFIL